MSGRTQTAGKSTLTWWLHTADKEPQPQYHPDPEWTSHVAAAARSTRQRVFVVQHVFQPPFSMCVCVGSR